jgi:hypothetical protein
MTRLTAAVAYRMVATAVLIVTALTIVIAVVLS